MTKGDQRNEIINWLKENKGYFPTDNEKNIFSIGGRGHYENPISDILKFFLNSEEQHKFGDLFLLSLFECIGVDPANFSTRLLYEPQRELFTKDKKRIDILLVGTNWVICVENKIWAAENNPFGSYKQYVYHHYKDKEKFFVVLSPKANIDSGNNEWRSISYQEYLSVLRKRLGEYFVNNPIDKWNVIVREFLLNIEQQISEEKFMTDDDAKFMQKNYVEIGNLIALREKYYQYLIEKCKQETKRQFIAAPYSWGGYGIALIFHDDRWQGVGAELFILVCPNGKYRIQFIVPMQAADEEKVKKAFQRDSDDRYNVRPIDKNTRLSFCPDSQYDFDDFLKALEEFKLVLSKFDYFYGLC